MTKKIKIITYNKYMISATRLPLNESYAVVSKYTHQIITKRLKSEKYFYQDPSGQVISS